VCKIQIAELVRDNVDFSVDGTAEYSAKSMVKHLPVLTGGECNLEITRVILRLQDNSHNVSTIVAREQPNSRKNTDVMLGFCMLIFTDP